ncbi:hypothetical protein [Marimonas lutisalis]|uniref:hypothetical protein n=1 Tax=Marimonas lutisalis TaxID=2545756 RepID=UPI0010F8DE07|nr:hypothetical protein [Marimonas lutisalis]
MIRARRNLGPVLLLLASSAILAGCAKTPLPDSPGQRWEKLDHTPPPEVLAALPSSVTLDDLIARYDPERPGPCYYYVQYGERYPLITPEMRAAGITDAPLCVQ